MAGSDKTEQASPKKREKAREQGISRSRELPSLLAIVGAVSALSIMTADSIPHWTILYRKLLDEAASSDLGANGPLLMWSGLEVFRWIVPVLLTAMGLSLFSGFAQGGFNVAPGALAIKFERFNPASKVGQMFSLTSLSSVLKSLLPFSVNAWIAVACIRSHFGVMVHASSYGLRMLASTIGSMLYEVGWKSALVLLLWAGVDYFLTWRKMEGDMKMTKQEVKDEHKQSEGSPQIKMHIRRQQRRMRRKSTLAAAKTATVVVTNPTHYAVALRYTPEMETPIVVAKGMNLIAQEIKALAAEAGITILENKPLAQALYKTVEVGDEIPSTLYQAVADILVIVFRAQAEVRRHEAMRRNRNASGELVNP
jgi:flagellar biosynthetic protein FlhB